MSVGKYDEYRKKTEAMLDQLFAKADMTVTEFKNANEALCTLEKLNKLERGDAMREEYGDSYGNYMPQMPYGTSSWVASGPYPDSMYYGDNYGRRMRSSTTGRYMNGNSGSGTYGHSIEDRMVANLEDMMDQAHNDYERQQIQKQIQDIRKGNMM